MLTSFMPLVKGHVFDSGASNFRRLKQEVTLIHGDLA